MPGHNLQALLTNADMKASGTILKGPAGIMLAWGITVPTDATAGYAPGCLFIHTDGTTYATVLYCNISTVLSCDFNVVTIAQ